jgi:MAF protein
MLVGLLGLEWRAAPQDVPEEQHLLEEPLIGAVNVALAKVRCLGVLSRGEVALAADTLVVSPDGVVLGKPATGEEARTMLRALHGRPHTVITGVVVRTSDRREWAAAVSTRVIMRAYSQREIDSYVERGEPYDKAGGYAVQDAEFSPVERLEGCYLNVVGLPLCAAARGLETLGVSVSRVDSWTPPCGYCTAGAPLVGGRPLPE